MKLLFSILLFLNINSLVLAKKYYQDFSLHKEIKFLEKFYKAKIDYPILARNLKVNYISGVCFRNTKEVALNKSYILRSTFTGRVLAIAHELAHCILKKDHDTSRYDKNNCPKSIMSPTLPKNMDKCIRLLGIPYYLNQLDFSKIKKRNKR